ncbi:MAG: hypothetical protein OXB97_04575 [Rhodospirillales bacterium]|nr:hypothetical protein [Rhodospirillales bacterium]
MKLKVVGMTGQDIVDPLFGPVEGTATLNATGVSLAGVTYRVRGDFEGGFEVLGPDGRWRAEVPDLERALRVYMAERFVAESP